MSAKHPGEEELRVQLRKARRTVTALRKELKAQIELNEERLEILHERMVLAMDGERPPEGILSTIDALRPFAEVAGLLKDDKDPVVILTTAGHVRAAAKTYAWVTGKGKGP